ncbi:MAG: TraR/DksA family transcriptional regulator [Calditrichia bacterium]
MNKKKLEYFKNILLEKRLDVLDRIEHLREVAMETNYKETSGDHSGYTSHMADQGTDAMEREKAFLFLSREEKYLQQIEQALQLIELGEYGICRVCGKEIDEKRMEVVPTTRICVPCKQSEAKK